MANDCLIESIFEKVDAYKMVTGLKYGKSMWSALVFEIEY